MAVRRSGNKLPKSQQPKAKRALQEIWMAETSKDAEAAFDAFIATYELKYDKAAECLAKDRLGAGPQARRFIAGHRGGIGQAGRPDRPRHRPQGHRQDRAPSAASKTATNSP